MTRPKPPLHQHLLTRSDLARLQVQAGTVLSWLADGRIEQVGALPDAKGAADPVFAVRSRRLRQELALRLVDIGKPTVVLAPPRVRSLLTRALTWATGSGDASPSMASHQAEQELADVLREVVAEVASDVDDVLGLTEAEAALDDAAATATATTTPVAATTAPTADAPHGPEQATGTSACDDAASADVAVATDLEACFDADELRDALAGLAPAPSEHEAADQPAAPSAAPPNDSSTTPVGGNAAPAPIDDQTAPSEPDHTMASESTLSSEPESPARLDASTPSAAAAAHGVDEPATTLAGPTTASAAHAPAVEPSADLATPAVAAAPTTSAPTPAPATYGASPSPSPSPRTPSPEQTVREVAEAVLERTVQRVESFLGELQKSLLAITQRPAAAVPPPPPLPPTTPAATPVDVAPIVNALQAGFERSAQAGTGVQTTLATIGEHVHGLGERMAAVAEAVTGTGVQLEHGMQTLDRSLQALQSTRPQHEAPPDHRVVPGIVIGRSDRLPTVLIAVAAMVIAWSVVFWVKMDSPRLAIATLIGANLVGCCLLAASRPRP